MTNRIVFTAETDAHYTESEKVDILDAFAEWFYGLDADFVEDSESIDFSNKNSSGPGVTERQKQEIIEEFLKTANFKADVRIRAKGYANDGRFASGIVSLDNE